MLITQVWKSQPGDYFCISTKSNSGKWRDKFFTRKGLSKVRAYINANLDKDIYFCPHGFDKARRLKEYAVMPKLLWADLDEADPSKMSIMPTIPPLRVQEYIKAASPSMRIYTTPVSSILSKPITGE